jgi:hypothetical protein
MRAERSWHGGHTLVVFETVGPNQIMINVLGSEQSTEPPRDAKTGRKITSSLCLGEEDIQALEDFLALRRAP